LAVLDDFIEKPSQDFKNPEETLKIISAKYPKYKDQFSESYNKYFKITFGSP